MTSLAYEGILLLEFRAVDAMQVASALDVKAAADNEKKNAAKGKDNDDV